MSLLGHVFGGNTFPFLLGIYLGVGLLDHMVILCYFEALPNPFSEGVAQFYIPIGNG